MKRLGVLALCAAMCVSSAYAHFDGRHFQPCDNRPPDSARQPVDVPVSIFTIPGPDMFARCRKQPENVVIYGCTFLPRTDQPAIIVLNADQDAVERACTLIYEESHLSPNNWLDVKMELATPDARPIAGSVSLGANGGR